jgi:hypothetical protein
MGKVWIKITSEKVGWTGHKWGRSEVHTPLMERPEKKRRLGRFGLKWEDNINIGLKTQDRKAWIAFMWLRIAANCLLFCML